MKPFSVRSLLILLSVYPLVGLAATYQAHDDASLRAALVLLRNGDVLEIAPGIYPGGHHVQGIQNLTVKATTPSDPPLFSGGKTGWQFSACSGLKLRHLNFKGQSTNGINLDDGGMRDSVTEKISLENLIIEDIGPQGNHDAIKCSGITRLHIQYCTIRGWGGQGIDLVGCHDSTLVGCSLVGKPGFSASAGIQMKGGSSGIVVEKCTFDNAGQRPLNVGGSTGLDYFRPPGTLHEAKNVTIRQCVIRGSLCSAAFVGVDGAMFTDNEIFYPEKWVFRILQENRSQGFIPCRNVFIHNNRIQLSRKRVQIEVNIGEGTQPETFEFQNNLWLADDAPEGYKPKLPTPEKVGSPPVKPLIQPAKSPCE